MTRQCPQPPAGPRAAAAPLTMYHIYTRAFQERHLVAVEGIVVGRGDRDPFDAQHFKRRDNGSRGGDAGCTGHFFHKIAQVRGGLNHRAGRTAIGNCIDTRFRQITVNAKSIDTYFVQVFSGQTTKSTTAVAVAGFDSAVCG